MFRPSQPTSPIPSVRRRGPDRLSRSTGSSIGTPMRPVSIEASRPVVCAIGAPQLVHEGVRELLRDSAFNVVVEEGKRGGAVALLDPAVVSDRVPLASAVIALARRFDHVVLFPEIVESDDLARAHELGASGIITQAARGPELRDALDAIVAGQSVIVPTDRRLLEW